MQAVTGAQIRAARCMLKWTAEDLAGRAGVGVATIRRAESADRQVQTSAPVGAAILRALERAGVELIPEGGMSSAGGAGVRLIRTELQDGLRPEELNSANDG